jgi:hypothetical protein
MAGVVLFQRVWKDLHVQIEKHPEIDRFSCVRCNGMYCCLLLCGVDTGASGWKLRLDQLDSLIALNPLDEHVTSWSDERLDLRVGHLSVAVACSHLFSDSQGAVCCGEGCAPHPACRLEARRGDDHC